METLRTRVSEIVGKWDLLKHPFYQSWTEGCLPAEELTRYAAEYGTFIRKIAPAWAACGYPGIAREEVTHAALWDDFAASLRTQVPESSAVAGVGQLNAFMDGAVEDKSVALGALLAFEFQQPSTVQSKLKGLRDHYANLGADEEYFEVHLDDWEEPDILIREIGNLDADQRERALDAMEQGCRLLWDALSGIHAN